MQSGRKASSGGPSLGRNPDAHKQRHPANQNEIRIRGKNRVDTIFGAGLTALLFFWKILSFEHRASMGAWRMSCNLVQQSFELASERCADLTPLVYQRLFRAHPEAQAMFRTEGSDLVKGSMLAMAVEAILDFAGERQGQFRMIACEVLSHDAYGTPRELFFAFFGIIADTLRELLGGDWSHEMSAAWRTLIAEIESEIAESGV
jgi:hemoglobin-like flavoprotein